MSIGNDPLMIAAAIAAASVGLLLNFYPAFAAASRRHPSSLGIFVVCLFLGWTCIGWVLALAWAYNGAERRY